MDDGALADDWIVVQARSGIDFAQFLVAVSDAVEFRGLLKVPNLRLDLEEEISAR